MGRGNATLRSLLHHAVAPRASTNCPQCPDYSPDKSHGDLKNRPAIGRNSEALAFCASSAPCCSPESFLSRRIGRNSERAPDEYRWRGEHASGMFSSKLCIRADASCAALLSRISRRTLYVKPAWTASCAVRGSRSVVSSPTKAEVLLASSATKCRLPILPWWHRCRMPRTRGPRRLRR